LQNLGFGPKQFEILSLSLYLANKKIFGFQKDTFGQSVVSSLPQRKRYLFTFSELVEQIVKTARVETKGREVRWKDL